MLALVTAVTGVLAFVAPTHIRYAQVSGVGQPTEPGLTLASFTPAQLDVSVPVGGPCGSLVFSTMAEAASPASLSVWTEADCTYRITSPEGSPTQSTTRTLPPGQLTLQYQSSGGAAVITADSGSGSPVVFAGYPANLDGIYGSRDTAWTLSTHATGSTAFPIGKILSAVSMVGAALLALSLAVLIGLSLRSGRQREFRVNIRLVIVAGVLGAAGLVLPPNFDDGWLLAEAKMRSAYGWFSTYFEDYSVPNPTGYWWQELTARIWGTVPDSYLVMRFATSILVWVLVWWICERCMRSLNLPDSARWMGLAVFLAVVLGTGLTLRQESFIALLLAIVLLLGLQAHRLPVLAGTAAAFVGGVALATHQTGWVVALPAAVLVVREIVRSRSQRWSALLLPGTAFGAAAAALLSLDSSASVAVQSTVALSSGYLHDKTPFDEFLRVFDIMGRPAASRLALAFIIVSVVLLIAAGLNREMGRRSRDTMLLAGAGLAGLMLTNSKWAAHYAATAPAVALAIGCTIGLLLTSPGRRIVLVLVSAFLSVWALGGQTRFGVDPWLTEWLTNDLQFVARAPVHRAAAWAVILATLVLLIVWAISRGRAVSVGVATTSVFVLAMVPALTAAVVFSQDASRADGAWTQTGALWGQGPECGVVSEVPFASVSGASLAPRPIPPGGRMVNTGLDGEGITLAVWASRALPPTSVVSVSQSDRSVDLTRFADPTATYEMWSAPSPSWFDPAQPSVTIVVDASPKAQATSPVLTDTIRWGGEPLVALAPPYLYVQALCLEPPPLLADALTTPVVSFSLIGGEADWWLNTRITTSSPTFSLGAHPRIPLRARMVLPTELALQLEPRECTTNWFSASWQGDCL